MRKLEEFVIEKLRVSKDSITLDIPLAEQGWGCTSINSMYSEIHQADEFLKTDIDVERLYYIDSDNDEYNTDRLMTLDKVYQAFKRRRLCKKIMNVILSEYTFEEGIEKVQEILRNTAKCEFSQSNTNTKQQVIRILDSHKTPAMVLTFTKL